MTSTINVLRAVYGDVGGSHNLVASSGGSQGLLAELAALTDRRLPVEVQWIPYVCGFPFREYYVLTRTFPVAASRAGMVQTHALLVPSGDALLSQPLGTLLGLLPGSPTAGAAGDSLAFAPSLTLPEAALARPVGYAAVVRPLLRGETPVWLGQATFEFVVAFLWHRLWPEARREFRFRVSAEPSDLVGSPATLVCTPLELRPRWPASQIVECRELELQDPSAAEAFLLNEPAGASLASARADLELASSDITVLKRLERYLELRSARGTDSIRGAARVLGSLVPEASAATQEKATVIARLAAETAAGNEDDVLGLRNLATMPFHGAPAELRRAVADWLRREIAAGTSVHRFAVAALLESHPWESMGCDVMRDVLMEWSSGTPEMIWSLWTAESRLVQGLERILVEADPAAQMRLVGAAPKVIATETSERVLALAVELRWPLLHAQTLLATPALTALERATRQIAASADMRDEEGLAMLARGMAGPDLVVAAIETRNAGLIDAVAQASIADFSLLASFDAVHPSWRSIWETRRRLGVPLLSSLPNPVVAAHSVFDAELDGPRPNQDLLRALLMEPGANLHLYARHAELLATLTGDLATAAHEAAAQAWLANVAVERVLAPPPLEPVFLSWVLSKWRSNLTSLGANHAAAFFRAFDGRLVEDDVKRWIVANPGELGTVAAHEVGRIVREKRWVSLAGTLLDLATSSRRDLLPAVQESVSLLSFFRRVAFAVRGGAPQITQEEWWDELHALVASLYPRGVCHGDIWDRSGGDVSRVYPGSGREEWTHALRLLRQGGAGRVTVEGFLHQMRRDFFRNDALEVLEKYHLQFLTRHR